ncbi:uncharacterized protein LOC135400693 isoform X2 [Ornithodoros turicata]|uniref:uncharacterized protein LOC135400693 isoform X2 n=1 Tax=Ornithodoros turicata TaxID=34597 RepID=UPI003139923E
MWRFCRRIARGCHAGLVLATVLMAATWLFLLHQSWKQVSFVKHPDGIPNGPLASGEDKDRSSRRSTSGSPTTSAPPFLTPAFVMDSFPSAVAVEDWQSSAMYSSTKLRLFIYSAYVDTRVRGASVRVIGVYGSLTREPISCRLEYEDGSWRVVPAEKSTVNEHWKLKYAAVFFVCPYPPGLSPPAYVRLKETRDHHWTPPVPVRPSGTLKGHPVGRIAACIKPLHYNYHRATWLVEFIEFHRHIGIEHFFFYNHSTAADVDKVLTAYQNDKVATVLPWTLAVRSQKEIRTEGLFAALNDCMYRTMHHFDYMATLDLDEFFVLRRDDNLNDLIARVKGNTVLSSFVFRNVFFYLYWPNDTTAYGAPPETEPQNIPYLLTQYKTRRSTTVFRVGSRSKYIVAPTTAVEAGNHIVWKFADINRLKPSRTFFARRSKVRHGNKGISPDDALLHHYRICEYGGYDCLKRPSVVDRTALRFNASLLSRVTDVCRKAFPETQRCPQAPPLGSPW